MLVPTLPSLTLRIETCLLYRTPTRAASVSTPPCQHPTPRTPPLPLPHPRSKISASTLPPATTPGQPPVTNTHITTLNHPQTRPIFLHTTHSHHQTLRLPLRPTKRPHLESQQHPQRHSHNLRHRPRRSPTPRRNPPLRTPTLSKQHLNSTRTSVNYLRPSCRCKCKCSSGFC